MLWPVESAAVLPMLGLVSSGVTLSRAAGELTAIWVLSGAKVFWAWQTQHLQKGNPWHLSRVGSPPLSLSANEDQGEASLSGTPCTLLYAILPTVQWAGGQLHFFLFSKEPGKDWGEG